MKISCRGVGKHVKSYDSEREGCEKVMPRGYASIDKVTILSEMGCESAIL